MVHNLVEQPSSTKIDKYIIDPNNSRHNGGRNEKNIIYHFSRFTDKRDWQFCSSYTIGHLEDIFKLSLGILVSYDHTCSQNYIEKLQCPLPDTKHLHNHAKATISKLIPN